MGCVYSCCAQGNKERDKSLLTGYGKAQATELVHVDDQEALYQANQYECGEEIEQNHDRKEHQDPAVLLRRHIQSGNRRRRSADLDRDWGWC